MRSSLMKLLVVSLFVAGLPIVVGIQPSSADTVIRVKGSDEMAGRVHAQSKLFMKDHPTISVTVSGGARGSGLSDLVEGNCEVVMSGHDLSDEEKQTARGKGIQLVERLVGYGGLVILTYPENPRDELTVDQLQKVLNGDYASWNQVGGPDVPVVVFSLETEANDITQFILHDFLHVPSLSSKVERVLSYGVIIKKVAETKGALGYCRMRDVEGKENSVGAKIVKIKKDSDSPAIMPSRRTIADETYSVRRPFYLCTDTRASTDVKTFVDFIVSQGWGAQMD